MTTKRDNAASALAESGPTSFSGLQSTSFQGRKPPQLFLMPLRRFVRYDGSGGRRRRPVSVAFYFC